MKQTHQIGLLAEYLCILRLWLTGWRILARRHRNKFGEIDLIARRGQELAFIEVKARRTIEEALTSITYQQQERLWRAAAYYLSQHCDGTGLSPRFDVMVVNHWPWPHHLRNAWQR
jgi:putative endonuclease